LLRRYPCILRFTDWQSADLFAKACDGKTEVNPCDGGTDWRYIRECPILSVLSAIE
jgi:hypothetical protein